jgi:hypothetical protein
MLIELQSRDVLARNKDQEALPDHSEPSVKSWTESPSFQYLLGQIRMTLMTADRHDPPQSLVSLGSLQNRDTLSHALAAGLDLELQEFWAIEDPSGLLPDCPVSCLPAAAAARAGLDKKELNLLRSTSAHGAESNLFGPHLRFIAVSLAAILICWGGAFGLDLFLHKSRLEALNTQITDTFKQSIPDAPDTVRPVQYTSVIQSRLRDLRGDGSGQGQPPASGSRVLETVSRALPSGEGIRITLLAMDGSNVRINGSAPNFKSVDRIKNALESSKLVQTASIDGATVNQDQSGVSFNLRLQLEDAR